MAQNGYSVGEILTFLPPGLVRPVGTGFEGLSHEEYFGLFSVLEEANHRK